MIEKEQILTALKGIIDPDLGKDIVSLGFIKNLTIEGGKVSFAIEMTTPACPVKDAFKQEAQERVSHIEGVEQVEVTMTSAKPKRGFDPALMKSGIKEISSFIAISSCKGGVGKSTVCASLALDLAARGHAVGLLDADIYGPSAPTLFNLHKVDVKLTAENKVIPIEVNGIKIISFGFLVGDSPAVMRGPMVSNYLNQLIHQVAWGKLDYLLIDMPPGTGDIQLTLCQTLSLDGAIIVTTPHQLSLADVGKGILMFEKVNVPVLGVVENMSYFFCEDNGKSYYLFGRDAAQKLSKRFGIDVLGKLPISDEFDLVKEHKESPQPKSNRKLFSETADNIIRAIGKNYLIRQEKPVIETNESHIKVFWPEAKKTLTGTNRNLRYYCNSAINVDERTGKRLIKWEQIPQDIAAKTAMPLGNYALSVDWNDGHRSIFPYDYFEEISLKGD